MFFSLRSVCLLAFSLILSSFGAILPRASNPIICESITSQTTNTAQADCLGIDYCYWDGGCKKDDCLEALGDYDTGTCSGGNSCNKFRYEPVRKCTDGTTGSAGPTYTTESSKGYCSRKENVPVILPCHYEFVKALGASCSGGCQSVPYNESAGVKSRITSPICVPKQTCQELGIDKCQTDPSCAILGGQCVYDVCYDLSVYNPDSMTYGECTSETGGTNRDVNYKVICKEYPKYIQSGTYREVKKTSVCGSRFGKYQFAGEGGNDKWNSPDPCGYLSIGYTYSWESATNDHGCPDPNNLEPWKCVQPECETYINATNCTSANTGGFSGVTCSVVDNKCTDGRPATYTPPPPPVVECPPASTASVFSSASVYVVLLLTAFVALLFN